MSVIIPDAPEAPQAGTPALRRRRETSSRQQAAPGPDRTTTVLGPAFAGVPAATGTRLIAFTIDVLIVAALGAAVLWATNSIALAFVVILQLAIGLTVALARTGATPGKLLLRLRASRVDAPISPGVGRAFVRALITGAGFVVGIGSWLVVASSAFDKNGRRQSWADLAAETVVVAAPRRGGAAVLTRATSTPTLAPPQLISMSARPAIDDDEDDEPVVLDAAPRVSDPVPTVARASAPAVSTAADPALAALLLVFDTGQRVRIDVPAAVTLGRRPSPAEPGDLLVVINDPDSTVSKSHLRLEHSRGRTWVTDLGSTNGSDILSEGGGRAELLPGERSLLEDGNWVRVGDRAVTINPLWSGGVDQPRVTA